jgi:hypothetical protein
LNNLRLGLSLLSATEDEEEGLWGEELHAEVAHLETKRL